MEPEAKSKWESKTIWVNGLALIATIAGFAGLDLGLSEEVQAEIAVGIVAVVNIVLRFVTKTPIK